MADTIVIIGAGFSGAVTAVHLLTLPHPRPLRVLLVNRSGAMARGLAYGTASREHQLNVPAGNMSALADDPGNFLRYAQWADPAIEASSFVPRRLYGSYLEALLHAAAHRAPENRHLEHWIGEAESVQPGAHGMRLVMSDGRSVEAAHVVLAFGHFMPADPPLARADGPDFYASPRYVRDPWGPDALEQVPREQPVLLIGSGLTAIDAALALAPPGRQAPIYCLSRRGLVPASHRATRGHWSADAAAQLAATLGGTVRADLRALRQAMRTHEAAGGDWRDVLGGLRAHTPRWWRALPPAERRRFLRHLQPYWDVARHRCAPGPAARIEALRSGGQLQLMAGRISALEDTGAGVRVTWTPRGRSDARTLEVAAVVNCTGPTADLRRARSPLIRQLLADDLVRPDALGLGVAVDEHGALLGRAAPLHYVGPLLRARDWEATAVPELRVHAQRLAERLRAALRAPAAALSPASA